MSTYLGTSANGWPVYDDTDRFVRTKVAGVGFWSASDDVAVVLDYFTQWFHDNIESLNLFVKEAPGYDDWSWAVRPVRGQKTGYSNHASSTARDLNSTRHPRGVKNTFTASQRAKLRTFVNSEIFLVGGLSVIRSGEFYSSTIDGMHIEINAGKTAVGIVADRIRALKKEFHVDKADEKKIADIVDARLDNWARTKKFIPNTDLEGKSTGMWTLGGLLEKSDQKADRANEKDDDQTARLVVLEQKVDAILAAVTPKETM